jgi:predicted RNA-binding Zn-ribbon protein involved in translation (DUF1610 family)
MLVGQFIYVSPESFGPRRYNLSEAKTVKMPTCNWCGRMILPAEAAVKFPCPSCGEVVVWRCEKCRLFGRPYKCPKCGFTGP